MFGRNKQLMIEITYFQLFLFITIIWIITRCIIAIRLKTFSVKREIQLLLVYVCIVVICRFVCFEFHLENGKIQTLRVGFEDDIRDMINIIPFYFLVDRYHGWQMNIIANIAMFIPVGIVWPICLTQLFFLGRHTDVDDLILNTSGVAIGACIVFLIRRKQKKE